MRSTLSLLLVSCAAAFGHAASPTSVVREDLLSVPLAPYVAVGQVELKRITLPAHLRAGRHVHPCPVVGVVIAGRIAFQVEGQPTQHLRPGDAFYEPARTPIAHFDNAGDAPAIFTAVYLATADDRELVRPLAAARDP